MWRVLPGSESTLMWVIVEPSTDRRDVDDRTGFAWRCHLWLADSRSRPGRSGGYLTAWQKSKIHPTSLCRVAMYAHFRYRGVLLERGSEFHMRHETTRGLSFLLIEETWSVSHSARLKIVRQRGSNSNLPETFSWDYFSLVFLDSPVN